MWTAVGQDRWRLPSTTGLLLALVLTTAACGQTTTAPDGNEAGSTALPLADDTNGAATDTDAEDGDSLDGDDGTANTANSAIGAAGGDGTDPESAASSTVESSDTAGCKAVSAADGINVSWWGLPVTEVDEATDGPLTGGLDILGDGQVLMQAGDQPDGVVTLFGAPAEPGVAVTIKVRSTDTATTFSCGTAGTLLNLPIPNCTIELVGGKPQLVVSYDDGSAGPLGRTVIRDGEPIQTNLAGGPNPIDTSAVPGSTYTYQIEMSDSSSREPAVGECGSITVPELDDQTAELLAAKDIFDRTALGPHAYVTVSSDGETEDLYLQALGPDGHAFVPPLDDPAFRNPFTIHNELVAAVSAGQDVAYELDDSSGLPTWWTVDGVTTKFFCFEVDTAPPELRVGPCDPQTDFIGR